MKAALPGASSPGRYAPPLVRSADGKRMEAAPVARRPLFARGPGVGKAPFQVREEDARFDIRFNQGDGIDTPAAAPDLAREDRPGTYIVMFGEAPLASYDGLTPGLPSATKRGAETAHRRLDVKSAESERYVGYLQARQRELEAQISATAGGRELQVRQRMQHAVNAIVVDLSPAEAADVARLPGVRFVEAYREDVQDTEVGPGLIGAPGVWDGSFRDAGGPYQGEGVVLGIIDSGINFGSPSFAALGPVDGYAHVNPLGTGTFLGTCAPGGVDEGRCNDKLIGGYDFVCQAPGNTCGTANVREEPGFGDTNGHGSHTASTAGGNHRDVVYSGAQVRISGVAPRASIVAFDACYTNTATGQGLCPNVSTLASINQAVADGVVDVINYSIGGGTSPWTDAISQAFLSAVDAGIYVAASAGNSGPGPNTMGHLQPWVANTAASQHGRSGYRISMTIPGLANPWLINAGSDGVPLAATIPATALDISPGIDAVDDGCNAYPAGEFTGEVAVIRRGTCSFSIKVNNAAAAGAVAVVIANNAAGEIAPVVTGTTIPVFGVTQAEGNQMRDFVAANPTATASFAYPATIIPNTVDALAAFSSRGPAANFELVKPDITGPGVNILAVTAGTTITGSENIVGAISGTSMASPHHAGSAALLRQAHPTWSAPEIRSALALSASQVVLLEDGTTPAHPFAGGSGRLQVDRAAEASLVMHETFANYQAANPATGGDIKTLNLPSLANRNCIPNCSFTRTFRNTRSFGALWRVDVEGFSGTANPQLLWIPAGASRSVTITIDGSTIPATGAWSFGRVNLSHRLSGGQVDDGSALGMPIALAVQPPVLSLPAAATGTVAAGATGSAGFNVGNTGGSNLNYAIANTGSSSLNVYNALSTGISSGFRNTTYTDPATAGSAAQYAADDFDLTATTAITRLSGEGFVVSGLAFPGAAVDITWSVYPDAAGLPAGNPSSAPGAAIWTYTSAPTGPGVQITGGNLALNLAAAGQSLSLPPGKYWLVINTRGTFANRWAQYASNTGAGGGFASITVSTVGAGSWAVNPSFPGLTMSVTGTVGCGSPWLGVATPASGTMAPGASQPTTVAINASGLVAGSYTAYLCVTSNDPLRSNVALPVNLTVN